MTMRSGLTTEDWRPFCGYEYPAYLVAGDPPVCVRPLHDVVLEKHQDAAGFTWWQTQEVTGGRRDDDH